MALLQCGFGHQWKKKEPSKSWLVSFKWWHVENEGKYSFPLELFNSTFLSCCLEVKLEDVDGHKDESSSIPATQA